MGEYGDFEGITMTFEHNLRHTVDSQSLMRAVRRHVYRPEPRGAIAGWIAEFWEFLCGR